MTTWIIYYGNGATYSDDDGSPFDAPARDVQIIAYADPDTGQAFLRANDYYWWQDGYWAGGDIFGLWDYLTGNGPRKVLFGRTIGNREYEAVLHAALENGYLPRKSAWRANERHATGVTVG